MEKELIHLTSRFLKMNRLVLFLLIAFPITLRFYSPPSGDYPITNHLLSSIGGICLLCWLFAIGHKANEKLISQGINIGMFKYFNWCILLVVVSYFLGITLGSEVHETVGRTFLNYTTPIYLPIIFIASFISVMLIAAKTLSSAEANNEVGLGNYFTTLLLMMVAPIGLWFIQPRVQNI